MTHPDQSRNPLMDTRDRTWDRTAPGKDRGPKPTLFANGDLPSLTACGIEPARLLELPWTARHAAAAEPDRAKVLAMFERFTPVTDETATDARMEYGGHPGNVAYRERFDYWTHKYTFSSD